jgi:hypothetical protein
MSLSNYQDVSKVGSNVNAGFQFEFYCGNCSRKWKSPFRPYRRGQLSGLIYKFAYFLDGQGRMARASNAVSDAGEKRARESALQDAIELAEQRYVECPGCAKTVCEACWHPQSHLCEACERRGAHGGARHSAQGSGSEEATAAGGLTCPNCQSAMGGGRFCAECGFDMASTHKSCPGCGAMCNRTARFCTDCGHGF